MFFPLVHQEFQLEKERLQAESRRTERLAAIQATWQEARMFFDGAEGNQRLLKIGALGGSLLGLFFTGKVVVPSAKRYLRDLLFRPRLLSVFEPPKTECVFPDEVFFE